jgi:hypothetical protein
MALDFQKVAGHLVQLLLNVISSAHCRLHDLLRIFTHFTPLELELAGWFGLEPSPEAGAAVPPMEACQRSLCQPGPALTRRPSLCLHDQVGSAVVLAGRAISVPFRARRHRFITVNRGHSRSLDPGGALLQVRGNTNGKDGVAYARR